MTRKTARRLAIAIVTDIMCTGTGQAAQRMVLELPDGRDGGGWSRKPLEDRICDILQRAGAKEG